MFHGNWRRVSPESLMRGMGFEKRQFASALVGLFRVSPHLVLIADLCPLLLE
jgi:hypothetical protein